MKLTRISTKHYNGQSPCKRCNPTGTYMGYINWACMMVEFKEIDGHYCHRCAEEMEKMYEKLRETTTENNNSKTSNTNE